MRSSLLTLLLALGMAGGGLASSSLEAPTAQQTDCTPGSDPCGGSQHCVVDQDNWLPGTSVGYTCGADRKRKCTGHCQFVEIAGTGRGKRGQAVELPWSG